MINNVYIMSVNVPQQKEHRQGSVPSTYFCLQYASLLFPIENKLPWQSNAALSVPVGLDRAQIRQPKTEGRERGSDSCHQQVVQVREWCPLSKVRHFPDACNVSLPLAFGTPPPPWHWTMVLSDTYLLAVQRHGEEPSKSGWPLPRPLTSMLLGQLHTSRSKVRRAHSVHTKSVGLGYSKLRSSRPAI